MRTLKDLFDRNRAWARAITSREPGFFLELSAQQTPRYLWIGCSDTRVPANEIVDLAPGELFVHRNVANVVVHTDLNCLSVLQYAVDVLRVEHVIVCGHYGCGGVRAALLPPEPTLPHVNRRIAPLCALAKAHVDELKGHASERERIDRLAELNVLEQVRQLRASAIVRDADPAPLVHGWIFALEDGRIKVLTSGYEADDAMTCTTAAHSAA